MIRKRGSTRFRLRGVRPGVPSRRRWLHDDQVEIRAFGVALSRDRPDDMEGRRHLADLQALDSRPVSP
jgi:hypothetical protein